MQSKRVASRSGQTIQSKSNEYNLDKRRLMQFLSGAGLFFVGGGGLQLIDQFLITSWWQEVLALVAVVAMAVGAVLCLFSYVVLAISRIQRIITSKP